MASILPSIEILSNLFSLSSTSPSGLIWKNPASRRCAIGSVAGCDNGSGYFQVSVSSRRYLAHRIVYQMANNVVLQASDIVDHIDGNSLNNDPANLRIATKQQNCRNASKKTAGASKYKGVSHCTHGTKPWYSAIMGKDGKSIFLGRYSDEIEAAKAYDEAARRIDSEYFKINF